MLDFTFHNDDETAEIKCVGLHEKVVLFFDSELIWSEILKVFCSF